MNLREPGLVAACALLFLAGCASAPRPAAWPWPDEPYSDGASNSPYAEPESGNAYSESAREPERRSVGPDQLLASSEVAQQLVDEARSLRAQGRYAEAYRQLERGVSISPRDAVLWFELARVRLAEQRWEDAENLAQRGLEYARDDMVSAYCWEVIARSREARGDAAGAAEARRQGRVRS